MNLERVLIAIAAVLFAGAGIYVARHLLLNVLNPDGKGAHRKTAAILQKYALIRGFKVLSGVTLRFKGDAFTIENMLVGFFGILIVSTMGGRGEYYGQIDGKQWQRVLGDEKKSFPNPIAEQDRAVAALRGVLSAKKLYNIPIEGLVYLSSGSKKTSLYVTHGGRILLPGQLAPYLRRTKFDKDTGLDVGKIEAAVRENAG
ncbi:MAG: NERD domain-containing protein [Oscillospiraceae bacterium]|nr:NERD domain-containing protein [Oscillospiraceae bacterium]